MFSYVKFIRVVCLHINHYICKKSDMKDRLQKFLIAENISPIKFAEIIGVQRSSISHILSGRNKPSFDVISAIILKFPKLSPDWLLLGSGEMYRKTYQTSLFEPSQQKQDVNIRDLSSKNANYEEHTQKKVFPTETKAPENRIKQRYVERVVIFYNDKTFIEYYPE